MSLLRFFFWFWFPAPQIGEQWTLAESLNDPWNTYHLTVIRRQGNWYRVRLGTHEESKHRSVLVAFYRKTADPNEDEAPF